MRIRLEVALLCGLGFGFGGCAKSTDHWVPPKQYDAGPGLCGNGVIEGDESCDDGNRLDGDGCGPDCQVETGWTCEGEPSRCSSLCGNGRVDEGEECDGSDLNGEDCTTVGGFTSGTLACGPSCHFDTTGCRTPGCGNGTLDDGEECDDGNDSNEDACLNNCRRARCGDGYVWQGHEECDDGNVSNRDGCLADCTNALCGDGYVWGGHEECDDGNRATGDGCGADCRVEAGWECVGEPSICRELCGNGVLDAGEECDDGNQVEGDGCGPDCRDEHLPVLYWATGDPAVWGHMVITYAGDPNAPRGTILAAANADQRGYAYVLTSTTYHKLSLPDHRWVESGSIRTQFPGLPGDRLRAGAGVSWPNEEETSMFFLTYDTTHATELYFFREDNDTGVVTADATNPYTVELPNDPNVPDLAKTIAMFQTLSNANGWTHHDVYALCSEANPSVQPGTDVGPYLGAVTESHELYLQDSGYCWRFYEHMPLSQFPPFTAPGAPDASRVVAMFYTTSHGERLYVVIQDPPAP